MNWVKSISRNTTKNKSNMQDLLKSCHPVHQESYAKQRIALT